MSESKIKHGTIRDLKFDPKNANRGTARGNSALEESIQKFGLGRSVLVDKNGVILAGNKTVETSGALGIENVIFIPSDGKTIVAVVREDLDAECDPAARGLAIADNRTAELDLNWDAEQLLQNAEELGGLEPFFNQDELNAMMESEALDEIDQAQDAQAEQSQSNTYTITFNSEAEKETWISYLEWLRQTYPQYETVSERLLMDISTRLEWEK